jgi:hypothetical protein
MNKFSKLIKKGIVMMLLKRTRQHGIPQQPTIPPMPKPKETKLSKEQRFVKDVINLANERNLNCFVVTDGASGIINIGNEAVNNARKAHMQWELEHGLDPNQE